MLRSKYDWLDGLFGVLDRPTANRVLPDSQHLAVGDKVPLGPAEELTVTALEPNRALVLSYHAHGFEWVWQSGLYSPDENRTRLGLSVSLGLLSSKPPATARFTSVG